MLRIIVCLLLVLSPLALRADEWRGHGGPVRALDISKDGKEVLSGGFDGASIIWNAGNGAAKNVLRFHAGSVDAVAFLPNGDFLTGGEDGLVSLWQPGAKSPVMHWKLHDARVASLAVSPDGKRFLSGGWDGVAKIVTSPGRITELVGHQGPINVVKFLPDGTAVTAGQDATLRFWRDGQQIEKIDMPTGITALALSPQGLIVGGGDGRVRFVVDGKVTAEVQTGDLPVIALAATRDGKTIAAAQIRGAVSLIDRPSQKIRATLVGPGLPVWSLAIMPDDETLISGGGDRMIRRWQLANGEPVGGIPLTKTVDELAAYRDDPGAKIYRACVACHTLKRSEGQRAGPTLEGIFGRKIGTDPDYVYSDALKGKAIVWTPETVSKLFEIGPAHYLPGTKMTEQTISNPADREALMQFLAKATK